MRRHTIPKIALVLLAVVTTSANGQTQLDLESSACSQLRKADNELNKVYKKILNDYKDDKVFIEKLKKAQKAWLVYRDAHVESVYPAADKFHEYGSAYGMCDCKVNADLTRQRTKLLIQWSDGVEQGDVCVGSRKFEGQ